MINDGKEAGINCLRNIAKQIEEDEEGRYSVAIVVADTETNTVRMWGVNLDEDDIYELLGEATEIIGEHIVDQADNRTLN